MRSRDEGEQGDNEEMKNEVTQDEIGPNMLELW